LNNINEDFILVSPIYKIMFSLPKYSDYFFMEYAMDTNDTYYPRFNIGINPTGICFEMTMYNKKYDVSTRVISFICEFDSQFFSFNLIHEYIDNHCDLKFISKLQAEQFHQFISSLYKDRLCHLVFHSFGI
jgi:hypothetical protein